MCGIFGLVQKTRNKDSGKIFRDLFLLSESRGKEAAGFALKIPTSIRVYKTPFPASDLVKSDIFRDEIAKSDDNKFVGIGHSRLVTNGYEQYDVNNQPVIKNGMVVIHNGIIVNQNELWDKYKRINKISDLDSELIPTIINAVSNSGQHLGWSIGEMFREIYGMTNIAFISEKYDNLILATNNGSIYYINDLIRGIFVFASERYILEQIIRKHKLNISFNLILQLHPGELISLNLKLFLFQLAKTGV
ncbi:MAG TPA: hypothetical protein VIK14_14035, partial [Ignavibacteria bacterium]